jgi:hypothetical protein
MHQHATPGEAKFHVIKARPSDFHDDTPTGLESRSPDRGARVKIFISPRSQELITHMNITHWSKTKHWNMKCFSSNRYACHDTNDT